MKRVLISAIFYCIFSSQVSAQVLTDFAGRPYKEIFSNEISGSPFLFEDWKSAKVKFKTSAGYNNVKIKFDVYNNRFLYNQNDSLYEFIDDIEEVRIQDDQHLNENGYDLVFRKDISAGNQVPAGKFVQVLARGKVTLLKYSVAKMEEGMQSGSYGSQLKEKKMVTTHKAIAISGAVIQNIQFNLKTLLALTSDKATEINSFIKLKDLNVKKEMDFAAAIAYYNLICC